MVGYYSTLSKRAVPEPAVWEFYMAYNLFRMAAILYGIAQRAADGSAASADAEETGRKAGPLARLGWEWAQRHAGA